MKEKISPILFQDLKCVCLNEKIYSDGSPPLLHRYRAYLLFTRCNRSSLYEFILDRCGNGRIYDIEMQAIDKKDLAKRIKYYQAAIDVSLLGKSKPYESLPDTFILFFCTFDYLEKTLPVYTFKTMCCEDNRIELCDGITKIIINSKAAEHEKNEKLKVFLEYMNGKVSNDEFIQRLEQRIKEVKSNEE